MWRVIQTPLETIDLGMIDLSLSPTVSIRLSNQLNQHNMKL